MDTPVEKETYWTFEYNGEIFDGEFDTREQAEDWAEEQFVFDCRQEHPRNNQVFLKDIFLIYIPLNYDWEEVERIPVTLSYTHYYSDREEHFRKGDYL